MCCFIAPMTEAVIVTVANVVLQHTEKCAAPQKQAKLLRVIRKNLHALSAMLWVVTGVLIIDHVANGELTFTYPFFTAAVSSNGISQMLHEIYTVGIAMSIFVTIAWAILLLLKYNSKNSEVTNG